MYIHIHSYTYIYIIYVQIHTYTSIHIQILTYIHIHTMTWAEFIYMHVHTYMHIQTYTFIHIHIQASSNRCQVVFLRGRQPTPSGLWMDAKFDQTCCDRPSDWIVVRGSCMGDIRQDREERSRGPGRVQRGGVRKIGSAQTLPWAKKSGCSGALSVARRLPSRETVFR
jgi:hypothetical protein